MPDSLTPEDNQLKTGPPLVGFVMNWWLWGILIMQYVMYMNHAQAKNDRRVLRATVHLLFLLDAVQSILVMVDAFHWFVFNFGNYAALLDLEVSSINGPLLDGIIAFVVQLVYCWRIWVLNQKSVWLPIIITLFALAGCVGGVFSGIEALKVKYTPGLLGHVHYNILLWNGASAATDVLIALSMTYLILKLRRRSGSSSTTHRLLRVLTRIGILTLEANVITTIATIVTMTVVVIGPIGPPFTTIYLSGGYILGKLHSNCFMVLLNQRTYYTTSDTTTVHADIETAIVTTRSVAASQTLRRHPDGNVASTSPASTVVIANSSPEGHVDVKEDRNSAELSHV